MEGVLGLANAVNVGPRSAYLSAIRPDVAYTTGPNLGMVAATDLGLLRQMRRASRFGLKRQAATAPLATKNHITTSTTCIQLGAPEEFFTTAGQSSATVIAVKAPPISAQTAAANVMRARRRLL